MTKHNIWNELDRLPPHAEEGWAIWKKRALRCVDLLEVKNMVRKWLPQNPILVGRPNDRLFLPPVCIPELRDDILKRIYYNSLKLIIPAICTSIIMFALALISGQIQLLSLSLLFLLLAVAFSLDYYIGLRDESGVYERAMFFYWLRTSPSTKLAVFFWIAVSMVIAGTQLLFQALWGGQAIAFHTYGVMYEAIEAGEIWRFATGPFLHYSLIHFLLNGFLLVFIGTLTGALLGYSSIIVFASGNIFAAFAQWQWGGRLFDNYGGISGGIYALFGLLIIASFINKELVPRGFGVLCLGLASVGIVSAAIVNDGSANAAHVSGFVFGGACALIIHVTRYLWLGIGHSSRSSK